MKKVKIAFYVIIIGFVTLVVYQNWVYFNQRQQFSVNLFYDQYVTPEFSNLCFFLFCFLIGLFLSYLYGLMERYKSKKLIKKLNATTAAQHGEISSLKRELEMLQKSAAGNGSPIPAPSGPVPGVPSE